MDYKGYYISDVQSEILIDILQTQREILAELKKLNEPVTNVQIDVDVIQDDECIGLTEKALPTVVSMLNEINDGNVIMDTSTVVKCEKPALNEIKPKQVSKSPAKKKSTKKKPANRTKTATK
jgi:hypothetical protein